MEDRAGQLPTIKYGNNRIQFQGVKLVNADQALDVDGSFSLGDNPQIGGIEVHAKNVDIAQLEKLALMNRGFSGRLNADAKIAGSAKAPVGHRAPRRRQRRLPAVQVPVADRRRHLTTAPHRPRRAAGADARRRADREGHGADERVARRPRPGGGHTQRRARPTRSICSIQSTAVDLGIVQGFTKELTNVTGTLQADVRVTGSGADPHLDGYVDAAERRASRCRRPTSRSRGMTTPHRAAAGAHPRPEVPDPRSARQRR